MMKLHFYVFDLRDWLGLRYSFVVLTLLYLAKLLEFWSIDFFFLIFVKMLIY